jgi:HTH-type transcriptional regulator, sugar sensing transcriptional regulator
MIEKNQLKQTLEKLGFTQKEAQIYLAMLELNEAAPSTIARVTGVKRSTTYTILENLQLRGLVKSNKQGPHITFQALDPKIFIKKQKQRFSEFRHSIENLESGLPELKALHSKYRSKNRELSSRKLPKGISMLSQEEIFKQLSKQNLKEGNKIAIISYKDKMGIIIENLALVNGEKELFKLAQAAKQSISKSK